MYLGFFLLVVCFFNCSFAPPVRNKKSEVDGLFKDLHYNEYLIQVLKELENDQEFSNKVKAASDHNRTEHIAQSLIFVNHKIRNKLDEIKRKEIDRLIALEHELQRRQLEKEGKHAGKPHRDLDKFLFFDSEHIDKENPNSFEISDLEKLIKKTEQDLKKVDKGQEEQYKLHEMHKEHLRREKLKNAKTAEERKKLEDEFKIKDERHKSHEKVNRPGSQEQLKEVWEKADHLDSNKFNPRAFFDIHDMNGDGLLDINEVEALMQNELNKVYDPNNTDDDMQEKYHETMRMRQEMMNLIDKNKDQLVSRDEFIQYTNNPSFKDDSEWKTGEELPNKPYSEEELNDYENEYPKMNDEDDDDYFSDVDESLNPHHEQPTHLNNDKVNQPPVKPDDKPHKL